MGLRAKVNLYLLSLVLEHAGERYEPGGDGRGSSGRERGSTTRSRARDPTCVLLLDLARETVAPRGETGWTGQRPGCEF